MCVWTISWKCKMKKKKVQILGKYYILFYESNKYMYVALRL